MPIRTLALTAITAVMLLSVASQHALAAPVTFYVAPNGNDAWHGQLPAQNSSKSDGPFATLARAQSALAALPSGQRSNGVDILLRAGTYRVAAPINLGEQSSGTGTAPLVIAAYPGEVVTISGTVPITNWHPLKDRIVQADLASTGLSQAGIAALAPTKAGNELFMGGARMDLARWPNRTSSPGAGDWAFVAGVPVKDTKSQFYCAGENPSKWAHPELAQVYIFAKFDWRDEWRSVTAVDPATHTITIAPETSYEIVSGHRYFVRNVFEELDAPGEWYLDSAAKAIDFYPPDSSTAPANVELSVAPSVFVLDHAHNVTLRGLAISGVTGSAITVSASTGVHVEQCDIANSRGNGIALKDSDACTISGCRIHNTGQCGIVADGGDRITLTPSSITVTNNHIYRFGRVDECYKPAVSVRGVGVSVTHNLIHDGPHAAILIAGNDHEIAYNEIYRVCLDSQDCGAIYMGRDWTFRGNTICYNKIHDVPGFGFVNYDKAHNEVVYTTPRDAAAVYLDDGVSSFDVVGNVIYRIGHLGVELGGGRDNLIANNIFVDASTGIGADARYIGWAVKMTDTFRERLAAIPYTKPPWSTRYPKLAAPMRHDSWPEGNAITGNVIARTAPSGTPISYFDVPSDAVTIDKNLYWNGGGPVTIGVRQIDKSPKRVTVPFAEWQATGFDAGGVAADPLFVAPDRDDYRLHPGSPAIKAGFSAIPWDQIGLLPNFPAAWRPDPAEPRTVSMTPRMFRYPLTLIPTPTPAIAGNGPVPAQ